MGNGHQLLTKVTGTGCLFTSVIGAFCAVEKTFAVPLYLQPLLWNSGRVGRGENGKPGPGSFQIEFLNQLAAVEAMDIKERGRIREVE